jgi:alpha-tubulin suppressor-like RCC1 family protein
LQDDTVQCWGKGSFGKLGNNSQSDNLVPLPLQYLKGNIKNLVLSDNHSCALLTNGLVQCWGGNLYGALGESDLTLTRLTPSTPLSYYGGLSNSSQITTGTSHTCILMGGGFPKCFGNNTSGQLGIGTNTSTSTPSFVQNLPALVSQIALGDNHSCFLGTDGLVYCTGDNSNGQLGNGTTNSQSVVSTVNGISGNAKIASGKNHMCAITVDGSLYCWGMNSNGQLGVNNTIKQLSPKSVVGLSESLTDVVAGRTHTCALGKSKAVYCWGANNYGQLGMNNYVSSYIPTKVNSLSGVNVTKVIAGEYHTCAQADDKTMYCWGANESGQLGNNTLTKSSIPILVQSP